MPRDLTRVKSKILFNLTKRQLVCFGAAVLIGVPSFFGIKSLGNTSLATMCMIVIMLPLFLLAMYEKDGQPLEVIALHFIQARFIRPKVRPYQTDCYYAALMRQYQVYEEIRAIQNRAGARGRGLRPASEDDAGQNKEVNAIAFKEEKAGKRKSACKSDA